MSVMRLQFEFELTLSFLKLEESEIATSFDKHVFYSMQILTLIEYPETSMNKSLAL